MYKKMAFTNNNKTLIREMTTPSLTIPPNTITSLSKEQFFEELKKNQTAFIIKFGAEWCGPCQKIDPLVYDWISKMPPEIKCAIIDVDENFEIYAFLKSKKMVNGIPAILCYDRGNTNYIPSDTVIGADPVQVDLFFQRCLNKVTV